MVLRQVKKAQPVLNGILYPIIHFNVQKENKNGRRRRREIVNAIDN